MSTEVGRCGASAMLAAALLLSALAFSAAARAAEGDRGASLLKAVESGSRSCDELRTANFEAIGEYVMGRMVGSPRAHESMDELMRSMMGESSERQVHTAMGRRFSRCGGAGIPGSFGGMMGMAGMVGGQGYGGVGPDSMMGGGYGRAHHADDGGDPSGWAVGLMAGLIALVLLGALAAILGATRRRAGGRPALSILEERYASGQIDHEEFERRRNALGGSA